MFGPIMQVVVNDDLTVRLAPFTREDSGKFVENGGMQHHTVTQYLGRAHSAPTLEDELKWYDMIWQQEDSRMWGVWVGEADGQKFIGTSGLHHIGGQHFRSAVSGSMIFDTSYWGRGIARSIHRARMWYAFTQLRLIQIKSCAIHVNTASLRALKGCGYETVGFERNVHFVNGQFGHHENLECINPDPALWDSWWHNDEVPSSFIAARQRTLQAMEWADKHVTLL